MLRINLRNLVLFGIGAILLLNHLFAEKAVKKITFEHSKQVFKAENTFQIVMADLNNDGFKDAVFSNMGLKDHSQILFNDGKGKFIDSGQKLTKCGHGIGVGDLDKDGDLDLVITSAGWQEKGIEHTFPTKIYFNDGNGIFKDSGQDLKDKVISGAGVTLIDIDMDGDLDIFIPYYREDDRIYLNDGKGNFVISNKKIPENATFGDLNSDGAPDMLINEKGKGFITRLNDGKGNFKQSSLLKDTEFTRIVVYLSDLDNDKDLDVIVTNLTRQTTYPTKLLINDGKGNFSIGKHKLDNVLFGRVSAGDLNNDGLKDIVLTSRGKPTGIWLNEGSNKFIKSDIQLKKYFASHQPVICDIDNDKDMDILIPNLFRFGSNELWINMLNK